MAGPRTPLLLRLALVLLVPLLIAERTDECQHAQKKLSIAVYAQYNSVAKKDSVIPCIENIVEARNFMTSALPGPMEEHGVKPHCLFAAEDFTLDVYLSFSPAVSPPAQKRVLNSLSALRGISDAVHFTKYYPGFADAPNPYLFMVNQTEQTKKTYDLSLKIRYGKPLTYKTVKHSLECLCGTASHVVSVLQEFLRDRALTAIGPQGLVLGRDSPRRSVASFVDKDPMKIFSANALRALDAALQPLGGAAASALAVYGGSYWARPTALRFPALSPTLLSIAATAGDMDLFLDLLFPSAAALSGGLIRVMAPAPKPLPLYFPQYHRIPENDRFWGDGFTEWTLLEPLDLPQISKPLAPAQGGLGYYDLTEKKVRQQQAAMNSLYGGHGFVYYHYWFSGKGAPADHKVMYRVPELMLKDGEPSGPFMFSWANEPWSRRWTGAAEDVMLEQTYGDEAEWTEHFEYLLPFFKHEKYIKYRGSPMFILYRIGHFEDKLRPMMQLWVELAIKNGFPGVYFITTIGNFYSSDPGTADLTNTVPELKAAMQFWPVVKMSFKRHQHGKDLRNVTLPQYWGAHTGFDARPRIPSRPIAEIISPDNFEGYLRKTFACSPVHRWKALDDNYIFITAWNEWNEQAVMEPGTMFGFGYLMAMRRALQGIPSCPY